MVFGLARFLLSHNFFSVNEQNHVEKAFLSSSRWRVALAGGCIVLAALAAYHNSFSGPFAFDDLDAIVKNQAIRHLSPIWPVLSPAASGVGVMGRPVLNLSYALNYAISGLDVWSYHALNLVVHILAGLVLFGVVRRTLLRVSESFKAEALPLALMIALIWTVHPLQTGSVTYISQRAESLMALWYLLTLYCFIRGVEGSHFWYPLVVVTSLLGMATKEVMVTAPLIVLLYDRVFVAGSWKGIFQQRRWFYLALGATWLLLVYLLLGLNARGAGYGLGVTWWSYGLTECWVVLHYLKLAVWPHPLVFDYGPELIGIASPLSVVALVLLVIMVLLGFLWRPRLGFAGLWFFVLLAPTSSVVPVAFEPMGENRVYLPLAGVVVLGVIGLYAWLGKRSWLVLGALAVGGGFLTVQRNNEYRSDLSIWADTVAKVPGNARAHNNLGALLIPRQRAAEAVIEFRKALLLSPTYVDAHNNMGCALLQLGDTVGAIRHYQKALQLNPANVDAHCNLGGVLAQMDRPGEAINEYRDALWLKPDYP
ncbi:MAG TPA: tetratricopeptide repeat protein, partial [Opitutaceae bacterium]|nr:tetratricopeptide repeat protein [Opitutaceae bacterium]